MLPEKLSDLLDLAVDDCERAEQDPRVELQMLIYHEPNGDVCEVCMAGAVMHCTLQADVEKDVHPLDFLVETRLKLFQIDAMRQGDFFWALDIVGQNYEVASGDVRIAMGRAYRLIRADFDPKLARASWATYRKAADELRKVGL